MLRAYEVGLGEADAEDAEKTFVVWDQKTNSAKALPWPYDEALDPAFFGTYEIDGVEYPTAFTLLQERVDEWTLEKGCEVCCLEKDQVEKAIRIYAENAPSGLVLGVATDMSPQSAQGTEGACILEFLLGNVEKPGALLQRFPDPPNKVDLGTMNTLVTGDMLEKRLGYREHKGLGIWSHAHIPTVFKAITTGEPYQPRNWMERSGNKHAMIGNAGQLSEIIDKMEMICHLYMYPTAFTIEAADYVLPTQEWLESYFTIAHANKIIIRQPVVHLYETVNEGVIWSEIAHRCAELGNPFAQKAFDKEYLATLGTDLVYWRGQQEMMDFHMGSLPMSWDELAEMGTYEWISKEDYLTYYTYKTIDPKTGKEKGWNTPSKKVEPYSEGTLMLGRTGEPWASAEGKSYVMPPADEDYDPLIYYLEPEETNLTDTEYPIMLTQGRIPHYHHGTLRNIPYLRELYPVPLVSIHPETAEKYGVEDEQWVWVESRRGKVRGKAHVTAGIAKDAVHMERFWNPEYLDTDTPSKAWTEMNVNILTKTDGDTRGGAALSVLAVTGKPIKFQGTGEKLDDLDVFHPDRMASRILGMGDVLSLIERAQDAADEKLAAETAKRMMENKFDMNDMLDQFAQIRKMGGVGAMLNMLPGGAGIDPSQMDEKAFDRIEAMIHSMTKEEREKPSIINPKRKRRIAAGSGTTVADVNKLLKQFEMMQKMMKQLKKSPKGFARKLGGMMGNPNAFRGLK